MTIKSEDVRPQKRTTRTTTAAKTSKDSNFEVNDAAAQVIEAIEQYEETLKDASGGKIWMKMERENISFTTDGGVKFTKENPYQLVDEVEVDSLLRQNFRKAYPDEIRDFYDK